MTLSGEKTAVTIINENFSENSMGRNLHNVKLALPAHAPYLRPCRQFRGRRVRQVLSRAHKTIGPGKNDNPEIKINLLVPGTGSTFRQRKALKWVSSDTHSSQPGTYGTTIKLGSQ